MTSNEISDKGQLEIIKLLPRLLKYSLDQVWKLHRQLSLICLPERSITEVHDYINCSKVAIRYRFESNQLQLLITYAHNT